MSSGSGNTPDFMTGNISSNIFFSSSRDGCPNSDCNSLYSSRAFSAASCNC